MPTSLPPLDVSFHLGDVFRKARKLRGFSLVELATKAEVDKGVVVRLEGGKPVERPSIEKVANALGVTVLQMEQVLAPSKIPRIDEVRKTLSSALKLLEDETSALGSSSTKRESTGS